MGFVILLVHHYGRKLEEGLKEIKSVKDKEKESGDTKRGGLESGW